MKGENSLKLFGPDLGALEATAAKIKDVMATAPGITDLAVFDFPPGGGMALVELQPGVPLEQVRRSTEAHFTS